jgi:glutathione S-transferase
MKIYDWPSSPNSRKIRALVYELDLQPTFVTLNVFKGEHRNDPQLIAKNPNRKLPVLEDGDFILWESNAILSYLAAKRPERGLSPTEPKRRADVDRWLFWQVAHIGPTITRVAVERFVKKLTGRGAPDQAIVEAGVAEFAIHSKVLNDSLESRQYVAGELSVADFALWGYYALCSLSDLDVSPYPHLSAWLTRMEERASVKSAIADATKVIEAARAAAPR